MGTPIQSDDPHALLLAQIRECFGRVVYSHKAHEKCADIYQEKLNQTKIAQIFLSGLAGSGAVASLLADSPVGAVVTAIVSTALVVLSLYTKNIDPGALAERHKESALRLWRLRESYLSLLTDLQAGVVAPADAAIRRDELQEAVGDVYEQAPRTTSAGYAAAQKALKHAEEMTFSAKEIDDFLPEALRSSQ